MKRSYGTFVLAAIMLCTSSNQLFSTLNFGSRDSAFKVGGNSRLHASSSNFIIDGTLHKPSDADITGNFIEFKNGVFHGDSSEALITGFLDPIGGDIVRLTGNGRFRAEPGTLLEGFTAEDTGNRLEGQPLFTVPLVLIDQDTELTFAMQSTLNRNLEMNNGMIILENDLKLDDEVMLVGDGRVELNKRRLELGSRYSMPWAGSLWFDNALDVMLNCKTDLAGTWSFGGTGCLNGNGGVLTLLGGGEIQIDPNGTLHINDIHVTGLGDSIGSGRITLGNNATLCAANASFKIDNDFSINNGTFRVEGPTTFQIGCNDWTFGPNATLVVDGTTLWIDLLDCECNIANPPGQLNFTNLDLINSGTVKFATDGARTLNSYQTCLLLDGPLTTTVKLDDSIFLSPHDVIRVAENVCIDGCGATIHFADPDFSQLIIEEGKILCLRNITLNCINQNSLDLRDGARIWIEEDVVWVLEEDITFSQGKIRVEQTPDCNVFKIVGKFCRPEFALSPLDPVTSAGQPRILFELQDNTLSLENTVISGLEHVSFFDSNFCSHAIALSGCAAADIDLPIADVLNVDERETKKLDINFFIESISNELILRQDGIELGGSITFGDLPDNQLAVKFIFADAVASPRPPLFNNITFDPRRGILEGFPFVKLSGDPGIFLFSFDGLAHIDFPNINAAVRLDNSNAFVTDDHALMTFKRLQIVDLPIKQQSALFRSEGLDLLGQGIDQSFVRFPNLRAFLANRPVNALELQRQRRKDQFAFYQAEDRKNKKQTKPKHAANPQTIIKPKKKNKNKNGRRDIELTRSIEDFTQEEILRSFGDIVDDEYKNPMRILMLPPDGEYVEIHDPNTFLTLSDPLTGNHKVLQNATLNSLRLDPNLEANIHLADDGATLIQAVDENGNPIPLNFVGGVHLLNVGKRSGIEEQDNVALKGAKLIVSGPVTFDPGVLNLAKDTEFIIEKLNNGVTTPIVTFKENAVICIPKRSIIRISGGPGEVVLEDGVVIRGLGTKIVDPVTGEEHVSNQARLIIENDDPLTVAENSTARIRGIINVDVQTGGRIDLQNPNSRLVFGVDTPFVQINGKDRPAEDCHDIQVRVFDSGEVKIGDEATISFHHGDFDICFEQNGSLFIEEGGTFAINADGINPQRGRLKKLSFRGGTLYNDGIFCMGENKETDLPPNITGEPFTFMYDGRCAMFAVGDNGLFKFLGRDGSRQRAVAQPDEGFTGQPSLIDQNIYKLFPATANSVFADQLIGFFVQKQPSLGPDTVLYNDENGVQTIRTNIGISVALLEGDTILAVADNGIITGVDAGGTAFSITPAGVRS